MSVVSVVCFQVKVSATSLSFVKRSPTDSWASLCVIRNLVNEEALAPWGLSRHKQTSRIYDEIVEVSYKPMAS
jgi:hypothetical protein